MTSKLKKNKLTLLSFDHANMLKSFCVETSHNLLSTSNHFWLENTSHLKFVFAMIHPDSN